MGMAILVRTSAAAGIDTGVRLPAAGESGGVDISPLKGTTEAQLEAGVGAWLVAKCGLSADDPCLPHLSWYISRWAHIETTEGRRISGKYFGYSAASFQTVQEIHARLAGAKLPEPWIMAWRGRLGYDLIAERHMHALAKKRADLLAAIPADGSTLVTVGDNAAFQAAAEKAYPDWKGLPVAEKVKRFLFLEEINPGTIPGGYYILPAKDVKETAPHVAAPLPNGEVKVYWCRFDPAMPVLLPPAKWVAEQAAKSAPVAVEEDEPIRGWAVYRVTLDGILKSGVPVVVLVTLSKGDAVNASVQVPTVHNRSLRALAFVGIGTTAAAPKFEFVSVIVVGEKGGTMRIACDLGKKTWKGRVAARGGQGGFMSAKKGKPISGTLTFEALDPKVGLTDPVKGSWTMYRGTDGRNSSSSKVELVDNFEDAALAWVSDDTIPTGRGLDIRGGGMKRIYGQPVMGGYASPVLDDGRVFLSYYVPSGTNYPYEFASEVNPDEDPKVYSVNGIEADHVMHAFDARTGRTLWKRVYPLGAINFSSFNKNGGQLTPCVKEGRMYSQDTGCNLYCVDAATGRTLWKSDLGPRYRMQESIRRHILDNRGMLGGRDIMVDHTAVAGSVVGTSGFEQFKGTPGYIYEHRNSLHGFDRFTGKPRWEIKDIGSGSPTVWRHGNQEFFVSSTLQKGTICVEVETGKIRWSVPGGASTVPLGGDYLLVNGDNGKLWCYRMTPAAATKLWEAPPECRSHSFDTAPITDTHA
ncbi:PQQ-binding-like beta-propeller repeat protein, partial [Verrucomicrobiota bacterium]